MSELSSGIPLRSLIVRGSDGTVTVYDIRDGEPCEADEVD